MNYIREFQESETLQQWLIMRSRVGKSHSDDSFWQSRGWFQVGWVCKRLNLNTISKKGVNKGTVKHNKYIDINIVP